ncbi:MAG: hypothetical protein HUU30_13780 [Burkholderiaceae bacterium]|jgi:hypothetical protein|nr:hypothetical protein [Aquabacterium sp.]NUP86804.1 hypothetical protein [Burkholderiaceae bacterium]
MYAASVTICPSWSLRAWPPMFWSASEARTLPLKHVSTHVTSLGARGRCPAGQTLWAGQIDDIDAGLAWDWVQVSHDVVAMADPMAVVTNLRLLGREGEVLTAFESALHLNELVHALPWQAAVASALNGRPN